MTPDSRKEEEEMKNSKGRRWSRMILVMVFMALILITTGFLSPPVVDRATRALGWVIERLREDSIQSPHEEIRRQSWMAWPGAVLSRDYFSLTETSVSLAGKKEESRPSVTTPGQQASRSIVDP